MNLLSRRVCSHSSVGAMTRRHAAHVPPRTSRHLLLFCFVKPDRTANDGQLLGSKLCNIYVSAMLLMMLML